MWTDALTEVLSEPFAALQLSPSGGRCVLASLDALAAWTLRTKGRRRLSLADTHLVWGPAADEQRATITMQLRDAVGGGVVDSWCILAAGVTAAGLVDAVKACRALSKAAA